MDLDHCGMMLRLIEGLGTDSESMGRDAYLEAGPGQNFLSTGHTLRHFATANCPSELPEAGPYETWMENGAPTLERRANARWKAMLASWEAPRIDPGVEEALDEFVARRRSGMADEWD